MNGQPQPIFLELEKFLNPRDTVAAIASSDVLSCRQTHMVQSVLESMLKSGVTRMPVTTKQGRLVGIVSALDILDFLGAGPKYKTFVLNKRKTDQRVMKIMEKGVRTSSRIHTIARALADFKKHRRGAAPIMHRGRLVGILQERDFALQIGEALGIDVEEIMVRKPIVAKESYTIEEAANMMCRGGFKNLPVTHDNIYLGMVTPIDILAYLHKNKMLYKLRKAKRKIVRAMSRDALTVSPKADIYEAILLMKRNKTSVLPVVEDDELVGILTARDIVDALV